MLNAIGVKKGEFLEYKGRPLVRKDNDIYYGDLSEKYHVFMMIMAELPTEKGVEIPKNIAGLMMAAIISDTLLFRSPTVTEIDKAAARHLSEICGIEIEEFAIDMFGAGSNLGDKDAEEIFNQDYKNFSVNEFKFSVGQINSMNSIELQEIKEKIVPYVEPAIN